MNVDRVYCLVLPGVLTLGIGAASEAWAQSPGSTILPTDVVPLPGTPVGRPFSTAMQTRIWQRLPASFYFNSTVETTFRLETNPFQYPLKRTTLNRARSQANDITDFTHEDRIQLAQELAATAAADTVYRINPNVTAGWALGDNTQVFANAFMIRDNLMKHCSLNSTTGAVALGVQQNVDLSDKNSMQLQFLGRELWQNHEMPVLDYLPAVTFQRNFTPNLIGYANALLQLRFKHFMTGSMRELDPFYTVGINYQRGRWNFSASGTFLQNFRKQFGDNAITPENNYSIICDFEIDRQIFQRVPGLVAVLRAEPVYNFHSHATPGLAGMDFRLYYGLRMTAMKPALNSTIKQLRKRYSNPPTSALETRQTASVSTQGQNNSGRFQNLVSKLTFGRIF